MKKYIESILICLFVPTMVVFVGYTIVAFTVWSLWPDAKEAQEGVLFLMRTAWVTTFVGTVFIIIYDHSEGSQ